MNSLDNFFRNNKKRFDIYEPLDGHRQRFENKLIGRVKNNKPKHYRWWAIAASLLLLVGVGSEIYFVRSQKNDISNYAPEIKRSENYFAVIIKEKIKEIETIETPETKKLVNETMKQLNILDNAYQRLLLDFKKNRENKNIINAMIENFQKRIELLEYAKKQIEEIKQFKTSDYEYQQI